MKKLLLLFFVALTINGYAQNYSNYIDRINTIDKKDLQYDMCISPDKKFLAIATPSAIKIVDIQNFKITKLIPVEFEMIHLISFLTSGDKVLIVGNNTKETSAEIYSLSDKKLVKKVNPIVSGKISRGWIQGEFVKSDNYLVGVTKDKKIFILNGNTLELIRTIPFVGGNGKCIDKLCISKDESMIAFQNSMALLDDALLLVFSIEGKLKYSKSFSNKLNGISFTSSNELLVSETITLSKGFLDGNTYKNNISRIDITSDNISSYNGPDVSSLYMQFTDDFSAYEVQYSESENIYPALAFLFFKENILKTIPSPRLHYTNVNFKDFLISRRIMELSEGIYILPVGYDNFSYVIDGRNKKLLGYIYNQGNSIAFISSDGRFTGDNEAISNIDFKIKGQSAIPLASLVNQFYVPKLFSQITSTSYKTGDNIVDLSKVVKLSPELKITSPDSISKQTGSTVKVSYIAKERGDGIKEVRFYINGKLLTDDSRGFKVVGMGSREVPIIVGENTIEAVAISNSGYQSSPDKVMVTYKGAETSTNLYILGVGIDQYKNSKYNLNYALADATSITDYIRTHSTGIFKNIEVKLLTNQDANKTNIVNELTRIAKQANESDVFVLYYAGHGVMSEGSPEVPKDYFMALTDVYQMYGNDNLLAEKGLSAAELREWCQQIKAQKQVILLDACQSGGATETFAMRGASEEKAIIQLAQSTGVFLISSTGSEQYASEFGELKHGVFSYALLEGLKGAADGGTKDGKITIKELEAYLNDRIPELTQKYRGSMQFPNTWSKGMDFPIVVVR